MADASTSITQEHSGTPGSGRSTGGRGGTGIQAPPRSADGGGFFRAYKPEQGKWTRGGSFFGALLLSLWGGFFLYQRLDVFEGDRWWHLLITFGIPTVFTAGLGALAWWFAFSGTGSGDFLVATEGEMKKVSWSTRREVIGSTKVVIVITLLMALLLFLVDWFFIEVFEKLGVLRLGR